MYSTVENLDVYAKSVYLASTDNIQMSWKTFLFLIFSMGDIFFVLLLLVLYVLIYHLV